MFTISPITLDPSHVTFSYWKERLAILKSSPDAILFNDIGVDDLGGRALAVILQYSMLMTNREYESHLHLINIISASPRMRSCQSPLMRELVVDLVALYAWRGAAGRYRSWRPTRGWCVHRGSNSAKVLTLLIYRALRHITIFLGTKGLIPRSTDRFDRSYMWDTYTSFASTWPHPQMMDTCVEFIKLAAIGITETSPRPIVLDLYISLAQKAKITRAGQTRHLDRYGLQCEHLLMRVLRAVTVIDNEPLKAVMDDVMRNVAGMQI